MKHKQIYTVVIILFWATLSFAQSTTYQYNDEGWLVQSSNGTMTTTYSYDAVGNRTNKTVVSTANLPDMVTLNETVTPITIDTGADTNIASRVQNNGVVATTESTRVAYYLSTNATHDGTDVLLGFDIIGNLAINGFEDKTKTLTIPANTTTGTYYILFFADDEFAIAENNEDNNVSYVEITVNGVSPTEDITVANISITPSIINSGSSITVSATQNYSGTQTVNELSPIQLRYYLSLDCEISTDDVVLGNDFSAIGSDNISEIKTRSITIPNNTNVGTYYLLFSGDDSNLVNEIDEANNVVCETITITNDVSDPDLVPLNQVASPNALDAGGSIALSCNVKNQGNEVCGSSSKLRYYLSNNPTWSTDDMEFGAFDFVADLGINETNIESINATIPSGTSSGTWYVLFRADADSEVTETNEDNNVVFAQITIGGNEELPDLIIVNQDATPTSIVAGATLGLSCRAVNQGEVPTGATSQVGYYLSEDTTYDSSDIFIESDGFGGLGASHFHDFTEGITIPDGIVSGIYYILFFVDDAFEVIESDENNNVAYNQITIVDPTIELSVISQNVNPTIVAPGDTAQVFCSIANDGNTFLRAEDGKVGYFLSTDTTFDSSDVFLRFSYLSFTDVGQSSDYSRSLTIPSDTALGTYYILFYADYEFTVAENNESDNVAYAEITIEKLASAEDVTITNASISSNQVKHGDQVTVFATQNYSGIQTASQLPNGLVMRYYFSTDCIASADDIVLDEDIAYIGSDNASETESNMLNIPTNIPSGQYNIIIAVDDDSYVSETNESNNTFCIQITIGISGQTYVPDNNFENYLETNGMGNGIANDDYVLTSNINTVTYLAVALKNISDLTGIEDFIALEELHCNFNQITNLDFSTNPNLRHLSCQQNQITDLNISLNTNLSVLECFSNQLTELDVSSHSQLTYLSIAGNQITSIDVSNSPLLTRLWCHSNQLTSFNAKNGNNTALTNVNFTANNNPNLTCIKVDNATWSTDNWTSIDAIASFNEDCSTLGLNGELLIESINIYPNPTDSTIYIEIDNSVTLKRILIYDINGKELHSYKENTQKISLKKYSAGTYIVKVETTRGTISKQLIKQ